MLDMKLMNMVEVVWAREEIGITRFSRAAHTTTRSMSMNSED